MKPVEGRDGDGDGVIPSSMKSIFDNFGRRKERFKWSDDAGVLTKGHRH